MAKHLLKKLLWGLCILVVCFFMAWALFSFLPSLVSAAEKQFKLNIHIECWTSLSRAAEIERLLNEVLKEDYPTITIELEMEEE